MGSFKITLKMDEKMRKHIADAVKETVRGIPGSVKNAVRTGVSERRVPLKELADNVSEARQKMLLAMLPDELKEGKTITFENAERGSNCDE